MSDEMLTITKTNYLAPVCFRSVRSKGRSIILFVIAETARPSILQDRLPRVFRYAMSAMPNTIHWRRRPLANSKTDIPPSTAT